MRFRIAYVINTTYILAQYSDAVFPAYTATVPYPEASNITVGDGFYQIVEHLPPGELPCSSYPWCDFDLYTPGTHVIWGLNLRDDNITAAFLETQAIVKAFKSHAVTRAGITLDFLEIGNEADLYVSNGGRMNPWGPTQYVQKFVLTKLGIEETLTTYFVNSWTVFATNVSATAGLSSTSKTRLIGAAFASSSHSSTTGLSPQSILESGILDSNAGSFITT